LEEQQAEERREALLQTTSDPAEKLRLESVVFAEERAGASSRIIQITERHQQILEKRRAELQEQTLPPPIGAAR
jgi:hypothetical protein